MKTLGLYIHIPFCEKKCHYCAFDSKAGASEDCVGTYIKMLIKEITAWKGRKEQVKTVYFGGGTPSFIRSDYIAAVMQTLGAVFDFDPQDPNLEKTIEVNPGSASLEKLSAYRQAGFNRLSIGLQAAQDRLLSAIGRIHTVNDFSETISAALQAGFDNLSADLLFGLPNQTLADVGESLAFLLDIKQIRHISCYSLSIEPGTVFDKLYQEGKLFLPSEETEREMYELIRSILMQHSMEQYEISNFAFPGFESRHNSSYWNLTPYLGFGTSAASYYENKRWINESDISRYCEKIHSGHSVRREEHTLSEKEKKGDFMFLGLRKTAGVCEADYREFFNRSFFEDYGQEIQSLLKQGLIEREDDRIFLSRIGMDLANQVFMAFV